MDAEIGSLTIGAVDLDCDPEVYESYIWARRGTEFKTLGGTRRTQEFGIPAVDLLLELQSGRGQFIRQATVQALDAMYRTTSGEWTLTDWLGNEMTVRFPPGEPAAFRPTHAHIGDLWTYTMRLRVVAIATWLGSPYSGE